MPLLTVLGVLTGLAAAADRDPTVANGMILPGGVVGAVGDVSFGAGTWVRSALLGDAVMRIPLRPRVELVVRGTGGIDPEVASIVSGELGARAQIVDTGRIAVSTELRFGDLHRTDHIAQGNPSTDRWLGAVAAGASACLDGDTCLAIVHAHAEIAVSGTKDDPGFFPQIGAGLSVGRHLRGVIALSWERPYRIAYAGIGFSRTHASVDLGVQSISDDDDEGERNFAPILGMTLRFR